MTKFSPLLVASESFNGARRAIHGDGASGLPGDLTWSEGRRYVPLRHRYSDRTADRL